MREGEHAMDRRAEGRRRDEVGEEGGGRFAQDGVHERRSEADRGMNSSRGQQYALQLLGRIHYYLRCKGKRGGRKVDLLDQRLEDKLPLLDRLMRHLEPPLILVVPLLLLVVVAPRVEHEVVVQEEVEVDHARTVPERAEIATEFCFDPFQDGEEGERFQGRFNLFCVSSPSRSRSKGFHVNYFCLSALCRIELERGRGKDGPHLDCCVEELVLLLMVHRLALVHPARLDDSARFLVLLAESVVESRDGVVEVPGTRTEVGAEADEGC